MTAQLSRERLEEISDSSSTLITVSEAIVMARMLLAGMDSEPVGEVVLGDYDDCGDYPDAKVVCIAAQGQADWNNFRNGTKLYAAPPAPVAVPDEWRMMCGEWRDEAVSIHDASGLIVSGIDANVAGVIVEAHNACISAMLNSGPVTAAAVPDGWKLVPVEPTREMIWAAKNVLTSTLGWESFKVAYAAMLAAAPESIMAAYKVKQVSSSEPLICETICPVCHGETKSVPFSEIKYCPACNPDYPKKNSVMNCGSKK